MTTYFRRNVTCGNCQQTSEHETLGSTNTMGGPDLDLRPAQMRRATMGAWLQVCPHCRYIAPDLERLEGATSVLSSPRYRDVFDGGPSPELARRFEAYAMLTEVVNPETAGLALLRAAWVCDDFGPPEVATLYRRQAAERLVGLKPFPDNQDGVTLGAVLVDTLRRSGQFEQAAAECKELLRLASATGMVRSVLEYQIRLADVRDDMAHTVAEARKVP